MEKEKATNYLTAIPLLEFSQPDALVALQQSHILPIVMSFLPQITAVKRRTRNPITLNCERSRLLVF